MLQPSFSRQEILGIVLRISLFTAVTFVSIKWLTELLDPVARSKKMAKARARKAVRTVASNSMLNNLTDYEMLIAQNIINPQEIPVSWHHIGGLDAIVEELRETVILPIQRPDLFADSHLSQPPKGVLLHGPPGCGKTLIAKATAKEAGTRFINLDVSTLTEKWYGETQKLAAAVFSLAVKLQPCIIFIDEIDALLRARNASDHEATAMMKAQFMSFWDGLVTDASATVIIMGATNRPQDVDAAILRRMPATFHVALPDSRQREEILALILDGEPVEETVDRQHIAGVTDGFSGSDLREMCRNASIYRVRDFLRKDNVGDSGDALRPINMDDLMTSFRKILDSKIHCGTLPAIY